MMICFDNYFLNSKYKIQLEDYRLPPLIKYNGELNTLNNYKNAP